MCESRRNRRRNVPQAWAQEVAVARQANAASCSRSAFGLEPDSELRQSFHGPCQNSFVAARHDRSLYQFGMVGHNLDKLIVTQVPPGNVLSICRFVRSEGILWSQPGATKQLLERVDGEWLLQVVDGSVIHTLGGQDPLDLSTLASSRFFVNRHLRGCHSPLPSAQSWAASALV